MESKTGQPQRGLMEARDAQEVELHLSERGFRSIIVHNERASVAATRPAPSAPVPAVVPAGGIVFTPAVPPGDLATFFRQMASLLHAGFTPLSALADLGPRTANRRISRAAADIGMAVGRGGSMAEGFGRHADVFPVHVAGLMQAGETGGFLEYACEECALGAEADAALRQGLWVPKILFWQSVWSVLILQPLANNLAAMMSTGVAGAMKTGHEFLVLWLPLGIGLHVLCELGGLLWRQPFFAPTRDRIALMLPVMRKLAYTRAIASFTRLLRRLLLTGVSPEVAYTAAMQSVANGAYRDKLRAGITVLRAGNGLDAAMQATGLLEHDPLQLLVTGQRTGQWTEMLDRVTAYYGDQAVKATEDAKNFQKRAAVLVTVVSAGYVMIVATVGPIKAAMQLFGE